jgi:hypothetical protein
MCKAEDMTHLVSGKVITLWQHVVGIEIQVASYGSSIIAITVAKDRKEAGPPYTRVVLTVDI